MTFLVARFAPYIAILLASGALYAKGRWDGHASAMETWQATEAKAQQASAEASARMARKGDSETVRYITNTKVIRHEIEKLVPVVTPADDARCVLPPDFAGMWNRINAATDPAAADSADTADAAFVTEPQAAGASASTVGH